MVGICFRMIHWPCGNKINKWMWCFVFYSKARDMALHTSINERRSISQAQAQSDRCTTTPFSLPPKRTFWTHLVCSNNFISITPICVLLHVKKCYVRYHKLFALTENQNEISKTNLPQDKQIRSQDKISEMWCCRVHSWDRKLSQFSKIENLIFCPLRTLPN